jgi:hypothetical protein
MATTATKSEQQTKDADPTADAKRRRKELEEEQRAAAAAARGGSGSEASPQGLDEVEAIKRAEDAEQQSAEDEAADRSVDSRRKRVTDSLGRVGFTSDLAPSTGGRAYNEDTGQFEDEDSGSGFSLSADHTDNSRTSKSNKSVGLESDGRNVKASQEGLIQNSAGEDIIGSVGIGADGVDVEGLEMGGGWKLDVKAGPDEQKIGFQAPQELKWPPNPDPTKDGGFDKDLMDLTFPIVPGVSLGISASVEGGVELGGISGHLLHRRTKEGDDPYQQVSHWEITGNGQVKADIGTELELAVAAGFPKVAEVKAGLRANAGAEATMGATLSGQLDITQSVPVGNEKPKTYDKQGEFALQLDGGGSVAATFGAFVGFEVLSMEGDLYTIEFVKAPIADLLVGGKAGVFWDGDKRSFDFKPTYGKHGAQFDWMLGDYFKAKKLDAASDAATSTKADRANLKALKRQAEATGADGAPKLSVKDLIAQDGFDDTVVQEAAVKKLTVREQELADLKESTERAIAKIEERMTTELLPENKKVQEKRWRVTNFVRGDTAALGKAKSELKALKNNLAKYTKESSGIAEKVRKARAEFKKKLLGQDVDKWLVALKEKKTETRRKNYAVYLEEFTAEEAKFRDRTGTIEDDIATLETRKTELDERLSYLTDGEGAGEVAAHAEAEIPLKRSRDIAAEELAATTKRIADLKDSKATLEADKKEKAKKNTFGTLFVSDSKELSELKKDIEWAGHVRDSQQDDFDKASSAFLKHRAKDPMTTLLRQKWGVEGELLSKRVGLSRIQDRWVEKQRSLRKLMLGEYANERSEEEQLAKMAKYKKQYGSEGDAAESAVEEKYVADRAEEKKAAEEREKAEAERKKKEQEEVAA